MGLLAINTINRNAGATNQIYVLRFRLEGGSTWIYSPDIPYNKAVPVAQGGVLPLKVDTPGQWVTGNIETQMGTITGGGDPVYGTSSLLAITPGYCPQPCGTLDPNAAYNVCSANGLAMIISSPSLNRMNAGVLTSTSGNLGQYVIDWRRDSTNGPIAFTSGSSVAADTSVTVVHPFTDEVLEGGTYYPAIRFVYIDSIKYSHIIGPGTLYAPILHTCIPPVVVSNMTCSNGGTYTSPYLPGYVTYIHQFTYFNNSDSPSLASRSLRFDLDATNRFFAWNFIGLYIADQIIITHVRADNTTTQQLENWIVGANAPTINLNVTPKLFPRLWIDKITPLDSITYAAGDYLRIEIIPSATVSNTNWTFHCKCFAAIDALVMDSSVRQIAPGTLAMVWDATACYYILTYNKAAWVNPGNSILYNYHFHENNDFAGGLMDVPIDGTTNYLYMRKKILANKYYNDTPFSCVNQIGNTTVVRSGDVVIFTFTDVTDYTAYKTSMANAVYAVENYAGGYSTNDTLYRHYHSVGILFYIANSCGDSGVTIRIMHVSYANLPVFNDTNKTMIVTRSATMTNNYISGGTCDEMSPYVAERVSFINNFDEAGDGNYSFTTSVRSTGPVYSIRLVATPVEETNIDFWQQEIFANINAYNMLLKGWNHETIYGEWSFNRVKDRIIITDTTDPVNNFEYYRLMLASTGNTVAPILVYKKLVGVVTNNIAAYNAT